MKITDSITITELSRLMNKSRPTVYKYISDFEEEKNEELPSPVLVLFQEIANGNFGKKDIYSYCDSKFSSKTDLNDVLNLIRDNAAKIDLTKLKENIKKEIELYDR